MLNTAGMGKNIFINNLGAGDQAESKQADETKLDRSKQNDSSRLK